MFLEPGWRRLRNGQESFSGLRPERAYRLGAEPKSAAACLRACRWLRADEPESAYVPELAETKSETVARRPGPIPRHLYRCPWSSWRELRHRCDGPVGNARSMVHQ